MRKIASMLRRTYVDMDPNRRDSRVLAFVPTAT
jgi:hypothetical protein